MAAPVPVSVTKTLVSSLTLTPTINLDAATQIGDRTVITLAFGRSRPIGCTWPSPWSERYDINNTTGNQMEQSCAYLDHASTPPVTVQVAAGPAGTTTVAMLAFAYRFAAGDYDPATPPEFVTAINTGNPPNFAPSWTGEDWLAIAGLTRDGSWGTPTYPLPSGQQFDNIFGSFGTCYGPILTDSVDLAQWVSITTGTVTVVGVRGAVAAGTDATLAAVLPGLTSDLAATAQASGLLAATLPALTSALTAEASTDADLAATLPALRATLAVEAYAEATVAAVLPALGADLDAVASATGTLAATLPALTGSLTGEAQSSATLAAVLPGLVAVLTGRATATGTLAGTLPSLTADLTATAEGPSTAHLAAVLPALTASLTGSSSAAVVLAGALPALEAHLTATFGEAPDLPPERTLTVDAESRTLTVEVEDRTLTVAHEHRTVNQ